MASLLNTYMVYQFVRRLVTPFTQMPAYHLGLIDDNGDFIKTPKTQEELDASTPFDIHVINLKRLIAKLPNGWIPNRYLLIRFFSGYHHFYIKSQQYHANRTMQNQMADA